MYTLNKVFIDEMFSKTLRQLSLTINRIGNWFIELDFPYLTTLVNQSEIKSNLIMTNINTWEINPPYFILNDALTFRCFDHLSLLKQPAICRLEDESRL